MIKINWDNQNNINWLDKYIEEQKEQRAIIEKIIAPYTIEQIAEISESDEILFSN